MICVVQNIVRISFRTFQLMMLSLGILQEPSSFRVLGALLLGFKFGICPYSLIQRFNRALEKDVKYTWLHTINVINEEARQWK